MPKYRYTAQDNEGSEVHGEVEGSSAAAVAGVVVGFAAGCRERIDERGHFARRRRRRSP